MEFLGKLFGQKTTQSPLIQSCDKNEAQAARDQAQVVRDKQLEACKRAAEEKVMLEINSAVQKGWFGVRFYPTSRPDRQLIKPIKRYLKEILEQKGFRVETDSDHDYITIEW